MFGLPRKLGTPSGPISKGVFGLRTRVDEIMVIRGFFIWISMLSVWLDGYLLDRTSHFSVWLDGYLWTRTEKADAGTTCDVTPLRGAQQLHHHIELFFKKREKIFPK